MKTGVEGGAGAAPLDRVERMGAAGVCKARQEKSVRAPQGLYVCARLGHRPDAERSDRVLTAMRAPASGRSGKAAPARTCATHRVRA